VGDYFQAIADVEAAEAEAPALATSVIRWLTDARILSADRTDCVLGAESGYPPGPRYAAAVTESDELLPSLRTNGIEVHTTKRVFHPIQAAIGPTTCSHCGYSAELENATTGQMTAPWELFSEAISQWMAGRPGMVTCPHCGHRAGINDWQWPEGWALAVGFLGFTFWNWPPLSKWFIAEVSAQLDHRVVVTQGKL
jgi:uncharacterized Zn-finger protein